MPVKSCQCPERRAPITSRRWEVCSKPGDGTTIIRCKACGAIWTTRGKFADAMPYDIGPVTLPRDAFQHTRAIVALTMLDALLYQFRPLVEDQPKVLRHLDEMREIIEACGNPIRKAEDFSRRTTRPPCGLRCHVRELPLPFRPLGEGRPLGRPVLCRRLDDLRRRRHVPELHQHAGLVEAAQAVRQMGLGDDGNVPRMRTRKVTKSTRSWWHEANQSTACRAGGRRARRSLRNAEHIQQAR